MKKHLKLLVAPMAIGVSALVSGLYGTADANLTSALSAVTSYFGANIGAVVAAVVGIVVFIWLLRIALHSFGIRKPGRGIV